MKDENSEFDIMNNENTVASMTECTGLMQIPPENMAQAEAYADIYTVPKTVNEVKRKFRHKRIKKNRSK
ncbi:MAG: hypothetical protein IK057_02615 [Clostridia bacterium]|nr:hypothetical protein [Clostridia bacterium]